MVNSHRINDGLFPLQPRERPEEADFFWVEMDDPAAVRDKIVELACERIPRSFGLDPVRDVQVLSPMHKGEVGTMALNDALRARLNPRGRNWSGARRSFGPGTRCSRPGKLRKGRVQRRPGARGRVDPEQGELLVDFDGGRCPTTGPNWTN